jgi:quinohemoprotein ethanol dehydrogenase
LQTIGRVPRWLLSLALLALAFEATAAEKPTAPARVDDNRLLNASKEPQNWMTYGGSWSEQHYSPLRSIDVTNVSRLKPAWSFDFDTYRGQEATPVVVDGVMYVSSAWSKVFALDAKTGKPLWHFNTGALITAGPATYSVDGKQYVAVASYANVFAFALP